MQKVAELMTPNATTVRPDTKMNEAVNLMVENDIGCLPVTDADRRVVGIVTDRDICVAAASRDSPMSALAVADAMTQNVAAVTCSTSIEQAERLLRERQLHRLPVTDNGGRVIGMISLNDIVRAAHAHDWQDEGALSARDVGRTVAAVHEPRTPVVPSSS